MDDDDPIDALQAMPADQGGDEARQEANAAPLASETPADASNRVYEQGTQTRLYGRVKAGDLAARGIPSYTTPTGDTKPIVDDTGAAITSADPRNHIGYDSAGSAVNYGTTDDTGKPVLKDPYADAPQVTDKQGNQYSAPDGLPWKQTGVDQDIADKYQADQQQKIDQATSGAIAPYEAQARSQAAQAARAVKQSAKTTAATLAQNGVPLTDETGAPAIDLTNVDGPTLKTHINDAFNKEYAAPQANETPFFGGGQYTAQAQAIRQDIDNRKATANAAADAHIDTMSNAQTAQANADQLTAQRQELQASKLDYVNQKREAQGLPPISIPGAAAKSAQADQSFQTPQESAIPGLDVDGKAMPDSAIPGLPKSQADQPNQSPTFYDRVKNFFQNAAGSFVSGAGSVVKGAGELLSKTSDPSTLLMPGGFLNAPQALSKMLGVDLGKGLQTAGGALQSVPGIITNPAFKDDGEAKVGRFVGGVASLLAGGELGVAAKAGRAATLVPMLFAGGYADQHDAAQQHFDQQAAAGNPVPPDQAEVIAHRAGIIGGAINAVLGIPLEGAGKAIAGFFGSAAPSTLQEAFLKAYTQNGALGVADALKQFRGIVSEMGGGSMTAQEVAAKAAQGLKGVEDEITKSAGDRVLGVAVRAARDASIGAAVQTGQNLTTQTYDPSRGTFQDVGERAAEFGAMGGLFGTIDATRAAGKASAARAQFTGGGQGGDASGNVAGGGGPESPQGSGGNPAGPEGTLNQRHLTQGADADIATSNAQKLKSLGYSDEEISGMGAAEAGRRAKYDIGKPAPPTTPPSDQAQPISQDQAQKLSDLGYSDGEVSKMGPNEAQRRIDQKIAKPSTDIPAPAEQPSRDTTQLSELGWNRLNDMGFSDKQIAEMPMARARAMAFPIDKTSGGSRETPGAGEAHPSGASVDEQLSKAEAQPSPVEDEESLAAEKTAIERAGAATPELQARLKTIDAKLVNLGASGKAPATATTTEAPPKGQIGEVQGASPLVTQEGAKAPSGKAPTIDDAAHEAAPSPFSEKPEPTTAQKEAGNYQKGHVKIGGLDISIENPEGTKHREEWPPLKSHYGYVKGTVGADGDHVDTFIKPGTPADYSGPVFVVNQNKPDGAFDEHKAVIGASTPEEAKDIYESNYSPGAAHVGSIASFSTPQTFKAWAQSADQHKEPAKGDSHEPTKENAIPSEVPAPAGSDRENIAGDEGTHGAGSEQAVSSGPANAPITPAEAKSTAQRLRRGKLKSAFDLTQAKLYDVDRPEDAKKESGLKAAVNPHTEQLEIHHNSAASADSMKNVEDKLLARGKTNAEARAGAKNWLETAMREEAIHLPQLIFERGGPEYTKTYTKIWQQVPENIRKIVRALRNREESDASRGAEYERMVIQYRETGTITEANEGDEFKERQFDALKKFLDLQQPQPLEDNIARVMTLVAEHESTKREDGKAWKAEPEEKTAEPTQERGPPEESASEMLSSLKAKLKAQGRATDARLESQIADLEREIAKDASAKPAKPASGVSDAALDEVRDAFDGLSATKPAESEPAFYSQLSKTIATLPQETMTAGQARAAITKGAKPDEIKMSGILTDPLSPLFGKQPNDKISKADLQSYAIERQAKVQDVTLGEKWHVVDSAGETSHGFPTREAAEKHAASIDDEDASVEQDESGSGTHFGQYQLPDAEPGTYREQFVTWPQNGNDNAALEDWERSAALKYGHDWNPDNLTSYERVRLTDLKSRSSLPNKNWNDGHTAFGEIANPIVRLRRNIRTDSEGNKTLFLEEMQGPSKENQEKMPPELRKRIYEIGVKRAIREAAEEGATHLGWTTGEQQAERYDLSKSVDGLKLSETSDGVTISSKSKGADNYDSVVARDVPRAKLGDYVGKEIAKQFIDNGTDKFEGGGLKIGGEGLKNLYDVTLPRIANEIAKKFGGKVGSALIGSPSEKPGWDKIESGALSPTKIHSLELPSELRKKAIYEGFPLFAAKPGVVEQKPLPEDRLPAFFKLAKTLSGEGVKTPERLALVLDDAAPGRLRSYAQAMWDVMGATGGVDRGTHDWNSIFSNVPTSHNVPIASEERSAQSTEPAIAEVSESSLQKGADRLADWVAGKLTTLDSFSLQDLYDEADKAFGGTQANNAYTFKDATDAMESGVNRWIRGSAETFNPAEMDEIRVVAKIESLKHVLSKLPTQGRQRNEEMEQFQQFSTPPTHALVANWVANIKNGEMMLEPSAGLGGLAVFAKNAGAVVVTNEFSPRRKQMLELLDLDRFFSEDAEQLNNVLPADVKPTVVIMNPPFSQTAGRMGEKRDIMVGARHVEQALKRIEDGGRLVAIVGRGMTLGAPAFKGWWKDIREKYEVRAVIGISGKEYAKYGTHFDNLIMVIDKTGPTLASPITANVDKVEELPSLLKEVRNDRQQPTIQKPDRAPFEGPREGVEDRLPSGATGGGEPDGMGRPGEQIGSIAAEARPGGEHGAGAAPNETSGSGSNLEPQSVGKTARPGAKPSRGRRNAVASGDEGSGRRDSGSASGSGVEAEVSAAEKQAEDGEDQVFDRYQPSIKVKGSVVNATPLAESSAMASVDSPAAKYAPKIDPAIITQGILSDAQLETLVLAGAAHSEKLPSGETKGFFCGDGTGVGKTRQIVGIFLDNWNRGRKKGVWLSMSSSLLPGAKKGMEQLLWNPDLLIAHGKTKMGEPIEAKEGILFTSYNTLARETPDPEKGVLKRIDQIAEWLGPNFDGVIAMDEAHQMGNVLPTKGARGTTKPAGMALAGVALQDRLPNARVVYFSATGATDVRNLAYATRLGLWGAGTPFSNVQDFVSKIEASGVAAMEMVARDMKGLGLYLSRNISYNGVGYEKLIHELTPDQTGIYDELAGAWQLILNNMVQALDITDQKKNGMAKSAANSKFWGAHQRFFNQVITAMEMPTVIDAIEKSIAAGRAPVIQLVNTNEAQTKSILADKAAEASETGEDIDYDAMDFTPRKALMDYIERGFPTQQYEEYMDEEGNTRTRPALDSTGKPIHNAEAVKMREALLTRLAEIRVPENPLDMLLDHFGADNVAEVTGRTVRLVKRRDENGVMRKQRESWSKVKGLADANAFQDDKKKLLAFSAAGGTGMDYHADLSRANQRPRDHIVIQSGWRADSAVQGFGRTHRNNQKQPPVYRLASTNLNAQKRFVSTIARRLDQLGALTKGQRDTGSQGMMSAMDNLENEYATEALKSFYRDLVKGHVEGVKLEDFEEQTGQKLTDKDGNLSDDAIDIKRFLNRLLNFKVDMMNRVWDAFFERFANIIELARQRGELDTGMETIKAAKAKVIRTELLNTDVASGAKTNYQEVELTHPTKISDFETMKAKAKKGWYKNLKSGQVWAYMADHNHTTKEGSIITEGMLYSHRGNLAGIALPLLHDPKKWETVSEEEAKPLVDEQIEKTPKTYEETAHMITGALLPIWNRLHGSNKVYRVTLDNGKRLLGRRESEETIGPLLENFKVAAGNTGIKPERILATIEGGTPVKFADGTRLMMRRVYGDGRIEVSGPKAVSPLAGKFTERIGYELRYFLPTDSALKAIEQISVNNPPISDMGPSELHSVKPGAIPGFDEEGNLAPEEKELNASKPSRLPPAESSEFYTEMAEEVRENDAVQKASEPDPDQMADIIAAFKEEKKHSDWPSIHIADVMERAGYAGPTMYLGKQHVMWMWKNGKIASLLGTDWSLTNDRVHAWGIRNLSGEDGTHGIRLAMIIPEKELHASKPQGLGPGRVFQDLWEAAGKAFDLKTLPERLRILSERSGMNSLIDDAQLFISPDDRLTKAEREKFAGDPNAIGDARKTGILLDGVTAMMDRRKKQWEEALKEAQTMVAKLDPKLQLELMKRIDEGTPLKAGPFKDAFDAIADMDAKRVQQAKDWFEAHGQGHWKNYENFLKNLVPHYFEDAEQANKVMDQFLKDKKVIGGTNFLKHRADVSMREIIDWAATKGIILKPKHTNVVDAIMDRWAQQERYFGAHELIEMMERQGLGHWEDMSGKKAYIAKPGEREVNNIIGSRVVEGEDGHRKRQHFFANEPSARVINNYLSRGLRQGHKWVDNYFHAANVLNALQLGFSGFHAGFVVIEGMVSTLARGLEQVMKGGAHAITGKGGLNEILAGLKDTIKAPFSTVGDFKLGGKIQKEMMSPGSMGGAMTTIVDMMVQGGYRQGVDSFYKDNHIKALFDAIHGHKVFTGVLRAPLALIELIAKPIMEILVPRMKAAVVYRVAEMHLRQNPEMTGMEMRRKIQEDVRSGNNRLGQMTYDNLHLHKTVKDLLMGMMRSLGWNWGTFAELFGGFADWAAFAKNAAIYGARKIGGGGKKPPGGEDGDANDDEYAPGGAKFPRVTNKMFYTLALPLLVGMFGLVLSAFFGKKPRTLKDYYFVQTNDIDDHGNPVRVVLPSYMKDLFHVFRHPLSTITNKLHPILSMLAQMLENRDFYGIEIRHSGDPVMKQLLEEVKYVAKEAIPFTGRNLQKSQSLPLKAAGLVGITQAPAYASKTNAQELADEINSEKMPAAARTQAEADHSALRSQIVGLERVGRGADLLAKSEAAGKITPKDASYISRAATMTRLQASVSHLSVEDAERVLEKASPEEKREIAPMIAAKKARATIFMYAGSQ